MSGSTTLRDDYQLSALNATILELRKQVKELKETRPVVIGPVLFTTPSSVANTFPFSVVVPGGMTPSALVIGKIDNLTSPTVSLTSAITLHWEAVGSGLVKIKYIAGLSTSTSYSMTLLAARSI